MRAYVASPLGFSEAGRYFMYNEMLPKLEVAGITILDPWALTSEEELAPIISLPYSAEKRSKWQAMNPIIAKRNTEAIDQADFLVAVLDGVDIDSGTSAEIGYAFAKGKRIIGYRGDFRLSADNEGSTVNLQVEYFIRESGGCIVSSLEELLTKL
ncbi:MAG: nucleoside 2-deoxyribosyltransferase [Lentisphaeria bacterium]|nr:nucleoside 2-deoxyribosyltransferase [Lentisphaeria bacterium]